MRRRSDISFCMIVRDDPVRLRACIESVAPVVDELVVVDTGSTDETEEVARSLGARTARIDWPDDFAAARNACLRLARCSWVLSLDADETLSEAGREQVRAVAEDAACAFAFDVRNHFSLADSGLPHAPSEFAGEIRLGVGYTISRTVRLFPRRRGIAYAYPVHESLVPSLRRRGVRIRLLRPPSIDHTGYLDDPDARAAKLDLYRRLGTTKIARFPDHAGGYLELGRLFLWDGDLDAAARLFRACLRRSPGCALAHYFYVLAHLWSGRRELAARHLRLALAMLPRDTDLLFLRGLLAIEAGDTRGGAADLAPALRGVSGRSAARAG